MLPACEQEYSHKNLCSQCGSLRPNKWCLHLRNAAKKAGLQVRDSPVYLKNLTQLRKNQRADKSRSGRKQPRKFDLVPIQDLYNQEEQEQIQLNLDASYPVQQKSTVDDVIECVVAHAQAYETVPESFNSEPVNVYNSFLDGDGEIQGYGIFAVSSRDSVIIKTDQLF